MADKKKFEVTLKIETDEQESSLRSFLSGKHPGLKPDELDKYLGYAKGQNGLTWLEENIEDQIKRYNQIQQLGIGKVSTDPPIVNVEFEELKDPLKDQPIQDEIDVILNGPKTEEPKEQPDKAEEIHDVGSPIVEEPQPKPEMVEITLDSFSTEAKIADAMAVLEPFVTKEQALKIMLFWSGQGGAEQPVISVPKDKVFELCEKLVAAGIVTKVPGPIEPEVVVPSSFDKKDLEEISKKFLALEELVKGIKFPEKVDLQPILTAIGGVIIALEQKKLGTVDFKPVLDAIAAIKLDEDSKKSLQDILSQIAALSRRIPDEPPVSADLSGLTEQISEAVKAVEELKFEILGGTNEDGDVKGLRDHITRSVRAIKKAFEIRVAVALILCGFLLGAVTYAVVLHFAPPKISAKIDQTEITGTVKSAVTSALDTKINATVDTDALVKELIKNEEFKKLLTPAVNAKVPGEPGGGITAPRTGGKH